MRILIYSLIVITLLGCNKSEKLVQKSPPNTLRIASDSDPQAFDPRLARDLSSVNHIHNLYRGLLGKDEDNQLKPSLANSFEVSDDERVYTFQLREANWSNGESITASDFVYSWKTLLSPNFPAPYAHQFYSIKGAKAYKEGVGSIDDVAVFAPNENTFVVELEEPNAIFLELVSTHPFFPISKEVEEKNSEWSLDSKTLVTSGPFVVDSWERQNRLVLKKNTQAFDKPFIDRAEIYTLNEKTALTLFEEGSLDYVGSPIGTLPIDQMDKLKASIIVSESCGTRFLRVNVLNPVLEQKDFRKSLLTSINRQDIVDSVTKGGQKIADGLIPTIMTGREAIDLFDPTVAEEHLGKVDKKEIKPIIFCYAKTDINHKVAQVLQQQWKERLGLNVILEPLEMKVMSHRLEQQQYDLALGSWYADIFDPINFLEVFKYPKGTNNTGWENRQYQTLLDQAVAEYDINERFTIYQEAEELLMEEVPIIPLFHATYLHLESPSVKDIYVNPVGHLDLSKVRIDAD